MRRLALVAFLVVAFASPAAAKPWWQRYLEARRETADYLETQRTRALDRRLAHCVQHTSRSYSKCVRRDERRRRAR